MDGKVVWGRGGREVRKMLGNLVLVMVSEH